MTKSSPIVTLIPFLLLSFVGWGLCTIFSPTQHIASESFSISLDADRALVAQLYTPRNQPTPHPVVILGHGWNNCKAMVTPLAMELARHGIATLTFDFGGFGESYPLPTAEKSIDRLETSTLEDARSVLSWIRDRPERFDVTRIAIGGHSMGGTTALQLGQIDPQLKATVVLSMTGTVTPTTPKNLWVGVGVYEQMHSPADARNMMAQATDSRDLTCLDDGICGNFATGTARRLAISATTDHVFAPYDARFMRAVLRWLDRALEVEMGDVSLVLPGWILGWGLVFGGGLGVGIWGVWQLDRIWAGLGRQRLWRYGNPVFWSMVAIAVWGYFHPLWVDTATNLLVFNCILLLTSNYALGNRKKFPKALRVVGLYVCLFEVAILLPAIVFGLEELWQQPAYLLELPQFISQWLLWSSYFASQFIKAALFQATTLELRLTGWFVVLVLWEYFRPGGILRAIERVAVFGVGWLRRPLKLTTGQVSSRQAIGLSILTAILVVLVHQRAADGILELLTSDGSLVLRQVSLLLLLPLVTILGCVRSSWFRRWESAAIALNSRSIDANCRST